MGLIQAGVPADLATTYITNGLTGSVRFLPNPNAGAVDLLDNLSMYRYNSLQVELRRRFSAGLYFQANYTFQKTLTDVADAGTGQTNFSALLDNRAPRLEYTRADYDTTHVFNFNSIYELLFGQGGVSRVLCKRPGLNKGQSPFKENRKLVERRAPVLDRHRPFLAQIL
ncbi:MAG TPA: hypothetical protein VNN73_18560 [Blastocatellia bacterium]|nr:hypothetical protein [Blastocatellia bacterium]